jgi:agmatinase/guanidinopropionase
MRTVLYFLNPKPDNRETVRRRGDSEQQQGALMDYQPLSGREFPRFSALKTFFRLPVSPLSENFDVALFGVPFDGGVSYRPGARFAPSRIREMSSLGRGFHWSRGEQVFTELKCADVGDCPTVPIDLAQTYQRIENFAGQVLAQQKRFVAVGGDHSVTLPLLRALRKSRGTALNFIHFDAHFDTYPAAWGCEYHHGSFLRHAVEEGLVNPAKTVQIGLRGPLAGSADLDFIKKHQLTQFSMDDIRREGVFKFIERLPSFETGPTYISYDIDNLDPAYAPGTGTPVPGGMTTYEVQQILRSLKVTQLVGADIVEVCPAYDHGDITSMAAVDAMFEILALMGGKK